MKNSILKNWLGLAGCDVNCHHFDPYASGSSKEPAMKASFGHLMREMSSKENMTSFLVCGLHFQTRLVLWLSSLTRNWISARSNTKVHQLGLMTAVWCPHFDLRPAGLSTAAAWLKIQCVCVTLCVYIMSTELTKWCTVAHGKGKWSESLIQESV